MRVGQLDRRVHVFATSAQNSHTLRREETKLQRHCSMQHEYEHLMDSLDHIALAQMFTELARKKIAAGSVEEGADALQRARPETATRRFALMTFFSPPNLGCRCHFLTVATRICPIFTRLSSSIV